MRNLSMLSGVEFEELTADLMAAEFGAHVERFGAGADGGIDLRWRLDDGGHGIGQCKQYARSTFAQLLSAARGEVVHLRKLSPRAYRFITSQDLLPGQKDALVEALALPGLDPGDVWGARDIDGLLTMHPQVERAHPKLWLSAGSQLFWTTHADLANRSSALRYRVEDALTTYVPSAALTQAGELLEQHRVCLIAGLPGVGKTTLAYALLAQVMAAGYEPVEVSADIAEGWTALDPHVPQVFLYDDFLGQLTFAERLGKNEDGRLVDFITQVTNSRSKLLIMTTREYVLQDAERVYPRLKNIQIEQRFMLHMSQYGRGDRARILYNHLWRADVPNAALADIVAGDCLKIIDHPNYSPRLIQSCTGPSFDLTGPDYSARFLASLDNPADLWRQAFEDHLTPIQQLLAVVLATLPSRIELDDLARAHEALCRGRGALVTAAIFRSALQVLEGSFIATDMEKGTSLIRFHNPSIRAFVLDWFANDAQLLRDALETAVFFAQVETLYRYSSGHHDASNERSLRTLSNSVEREKALVSRALVRLMHGPSPTLSTRLWPRSDVSVSLEERLRFLIKLPARYRPTSEWMIEQLKLAVQRWSDDEGDKDGAVSLVNDLEDLEPPILDAVVIAEAASILEAWLPKVLEETDTDWLPYLARLERSEGGLAIHPYLAEQFEQHANEELDRWHPSPPNMQDLIEYADRFSLPELHEQLEQKQREENEQSEHDQQQPWRRQHPGHPRPRSIPDHDVLEMFTGLAQREL